MNTVPRASSRALAVMATTSLAVLTVGAGTASAHVRASSADAAPGGYGEVTFRVPNESDTASTVSLAVQLPTDTPIASVSVKPVPGWTAQVVEGALPEPVQDGHGGQITTAVSQVVWTAGAGAGIAPGEYQTFSISAGPMPKADMIAFPAVQTYDDGTEQAWIEPTVDGQEEPESPSPVLALTAAGQEATDAHGGSTHDHTDSAEDTDTDTDTDTTADAGEEDTGASGVAVTALVIGSLALLAALAGLAVALRARRTITG